MNSRNAVTSRNWHILPIAPTARPCSGPTTSIAITRMRRSSPTLRRESSCRDGLPDSGCTSLPRVRPRLAGLLQGCHHRKGVEQFVPPDSIPDAVDESAWLSLPNDLASSASLMATLGVSTPVHQDLVAASRRMRSTGAICSMGFGRDVRITASRDSRAAAHVDELAGKASPRPIDAPLPGATPARYQDMWYRPEQRLQRYNPSPSPEFRLLPTLSLTGGDCRHSLHARSPPEPAYPPYP